MDMIFAVVSACGCFAVGAAAAETELIRGPYLQCGTATNIIVRWRTDAPTNSVAHFGPAPDALHWSVTNPAPTIDHRVTLTNLAPDTKYYYGVGASETNLASGTDYFFLTVPVRAKPTRIWAIGDAGTSFNQPDYSGLGLKIENQRGVRDAYYAYASERYTDVWLLLGDNAYNNGNDGDYQTNFFEMYPDITRRSVIWPAIGNHEVELASGDAPAYLDIFSLPTQGEAGGVPSGNERYYSFDYGNIHFVCLDSEISNRDPGGPMLTWLKADLDANTNDWLVVFWHSPPYSKGSHDSDFRSRLIQMRENVVPIIEAYGVDLVLCGHSHVYERSYLIDGHYGASHTWAPTMAKDSGSGRPDDSGPYLKSVIGPDAHQGAVYVVAGSSGWAWYGNGLNHPAMFIGMEELGSLVIDIDGPRLDAKFLRETGVIDDYFTIIKGAEPQPLRFATFMVRDGVVTAQIKTTAGQRYRIERATRLDSSAWEDASGDIVASGATTKWTDTTSAETSATFYRVVQVSEGPAVGL